MPRRTASSSSATPRPTSGPPNARSTGSRRWPEACGSCRCSARQRPSWRVSDLAHRRGLPMPTVYRVVMTLASEGYLDHLPNGDYRPGVRTLTLGTAALLQPGPRRDRHAEAAGARRAHRGDGEPSAVLSGDRGAVPDPAAQFRPGDREHPGGFHPARRAPRSASCCSPTSTGPTCSLDHRCPRSPPTRGPTPRSRWPSCATSCAIDPRTGLGHAGQRNWPTGSGRSRPRSPAPDGRVLA